MLCLLKKICRPFLIVVTNVKNGKPHVLILQDMEQDSLQFDLAADTLEEQYEWYQVAWDITQREMSKQYSREQEVGISWRIMVYDVTYKSVLSKPSWLYTD